MSQFGTWQLAGYLIFRGGLLLAVSGSLIWLWHWLLLLWQLPGQLSMGLALALAGFVLVMLSLVVERMRDERPDA